MIEKVLFLTTICIFTTILTSAQKCETNRTHIICEKRTSSNPLSTIRSGLSEIDTIIIHNSKLDLTDNLLNNDETLPGVSLFNVTDNKIERIGRRGFDKIHNVQFLYLSRNSISHSQPDPFMSLTRLEILEMNQALSGDSSEKEEILRNMFHSKNDFVHLSEIQLNNNQIDSLHPKTFCGVEGLKRLELSNNRLKNLDFGRKCFSELKALFISGNNIKNIPNDIWDWMPSLTSLDISNNPLHCDCSIVEFVKADDVSFINQGNTFCSSPSELKGKNIFDLPTDFCSKNGGKNTFFNFFVLTLIAIAVFYFYKKYRQKLATNFSKPVGYHNLSDEQGVQPEFV